MLKKMLLSVLIISLWVTGSAFADTLTIGLYDNEPLLITGEQPTGLIVDLLRLYLEEAGYTLDYRSGSLEEVLRWVERGEVDLVPGIAYSKERAQRFDYNTEPVFLNWGEVFIRQGQTLNSLLELKDKRIGVQNGDIHYDGPLGIKKTLSQFEIPAKYVPYAAKPPLFAAIASGEIDAGVANRTYGFLHAEEMGLQPSGIVFNPVDMRLVAPADAHTALLRNLDKRLKAEKEDANSPYHQLLSKWFDHDTPSQSTRSLYLLLGLTGLSALALGLSSLWLRSLVAERTGELAERNAELRHLNKNLEVLVEEQTAQMVGLKEEMMASEKMASLGRMVAGIAHEVNTPLGVSRTVSTYLDHLYADLKGAFSKNQLTQRHFSDYLTETEEGLGILSMNLDRTIDLIERFKMLSADYSDDRRRTFLVKEVLDRLVTTLGPELKKDHIQVTVSVDENLELTTFPSDFTTIFTNLIINAKKHAFFNRPGGVIAISAEQRPTGYHLVFSDNGRGLTDEERAHLFEPFFTTARHRGGTGLGLATVHSVVTGKMEGRIRVFSTKDRGTTFEIILPAKKEP